VLWNPPLLPPALLLVAGVDELLLGANVLAGLS
jgi:hypothetical protein